MSHSANLNHPEPKLKRAMSQCKECQLQEDLTSILFELPERLKQLRLVDSEMHYMPDCNGQVFQCADCTAFWMFDTRGQWHHLSPTYFDV